jgi:phage I-like protein
VDVTKMPKKPDSGQMAFAVAVPLESSLEEWDGSERPTSVIQLMPTGVVRLKDRRFGFDVTKLSMVSMLSSFVTEDTDLVGDYNHGMYYGYDDEDDDSNREMQKASGWGKTMIAVVPDEWLPPIAPFMADLGETDRYEIRAAGEGEKTGLFLRVEWTIEAAERIKKGEYRYISPVVILNHSGQAEYIWNFAIVNKPAIDGLEPIAASVLNDLDASQPANLDGTPAGLDPETSGHEQAGQMGGHSQKGCSDMEISTVAAHLGLSVEPGIEETAFAKILSQYAAKLTQAESHAGELSAKVQGLLEANEQADEKVKALTTDLDATNVELKAVTEELEKHALAEREAKVDGWIKAGVLPPAQREHALANVEALAPMFGSEDAKPVVPLGSIRRDGSPLKGDDLSQDRKGLLAEIKATAKEKGITFEQARSLVDPEFQGKE